MLAMIAWSAETEDDTLFGGLGNDQLDAGDGNDSLAGENDDDTLLGGNGNDTLQGDLGNDFLLGNKGLDVINGGDGDDTNIWNNGDNSDTLNAGLGIDLQIVNGSTSSGDAFNLVNITPNNVLFKRTNLVPFSIDIVDAERVQMNDSAVTIPCHSMT